MYENFDYCTPIQDAPQSGYPVHTWAFFFKHKAENGIKFRLKLKDGYICTLCWPIPLAISSTSYVSPRSSLHALGFYSSLKDTFYEVHKCLHATGAICERESGGSFSCALLEGSLHCWVPCTFQCRLFPY